MFSGPAPVHFELALVATVVACCVPCWDFKLSQLGSFVVTFRGASFSSSSLIEGGCSLFKLLYGFNKNKSSNLLFANVQVRKLIFEFLRPSSSLTSHHACSEAYRIVVRDVRPKPIFIETASLRIKRKNACGGCGDNTSNVRTFLELSTHFLKTRFWGVFVVCWWLCVVCCLLFVVCLLSVIYVLFVLLVCCLFHNSEFYE